MSEMASQSAGQPTAGSGINGGGNTTDYSSFSAGSNGVNWSASDFDSVPTSGGDRADNSGAALATEGDEEGPQGGQDAGAGDDSDPELQALLASLDDSDTEESDTGEGADTDSADGGEGKTFKDVPYTRFEEVNQQKNAFKAEAQQAQAQVMEMQGQIHQMQQAIEGWLPLIQKVQGLGFNSAQEALGHLAATDHMTAFERSLDERYDLTDDAKEYLVQAERERLNLRQEAEGLRSMMAQHDQTIGQQLADQAITAARGKYNYFTDETAGILAGYDAKDIPVVAETIDRQARLLAKQMIGEYAAKKQKAGAVKPPEGRGESPQRQPNREAIPAWQRGWEELLDGNRNPTA